MKKKKIKTLKLNKRTISAAHANKVVGATGPCVTVPILLSYIWGCNDDKPSMDVECPYSKGIIDASNAGECQS
ncbi:hypothetical protein [Kordia sp.]|uniref:hypothetical protein n=1 Tax=Kordia sp. TaxID=1965332 RepID=UPI003B5B5278